MMQAIHSTRPVDRLAMSGCRTASNSTARSFFYTHVHLHGGPAPVRRYLPALIQLVQNGTINPGKVFDLELPLEQAAEGYRAMESGAPSRRCCVHRTSSIQKESCVMSRPLRFITVFFPDRPGDHKEHATLCFAMASRPLRAIANDLSARGDWHGSKNPEQMESPPGGLHGPVRVQLGTDTHRPGDVPHGLPVATPDPFSTPRADTKPRTAGMTSTNARRLGPSTSKALWFAAWFWKGPHASLRVFGDSTDRQAAQSRGTLAGDVGTAVSGNLAGGINDEPTHAGQERSRCVGDGTRCMGMSWSYSPIPDRNAMLALLRAAVERGVTSLTLRKSTVLTRTRNSWAKPLRRFEEGRDRHEVRMGARRRRRNAVEFA